MNSLVQFATEVHAKRRDFVGQPPFESLRGNDRAEKAAREIARYAATLR